ncbi:MAG TPA: DMT family transporter [Burkholderiaceae bacterium]
MDSPMRVDPAAPLPPSPPAAMGRLRANALLVLVALVWGSAFVAQALGMRSVGPFLFTGARFALGAAIVAPLAWREWRGLRAQGRAPGRRDLGHVALLGLLLFLGAAMQQLGMLGTTVTNAGFLTALYIPLVPLLAWLGLRQAPHWTTWPAALCCLAGTWLLASGGAATHLHAGDAWVVASSLPWAVHVLLVGRAANRLHAPMLVATGQFVACAALALATSAVLEPVTLAGLRGAAGAIAYAGVLSVGLGFTLQVVAQRHARAADSAIVLSTETVFAAAFGAAFMGDRLGDAGIGGCALILAGVLVVQLQPLVRAWLKQR